MTDNRVDRLVIADSFPMAHAGVNEELKRGPADILRFPDIVAILAGRQGSEALQQRMLEQVALCRELHGIVAISVVTERTQDYHAITDAIRRSTRGTWRFEQVSLQLGASELAPGIAETWDECVITCVDFRSPFASARDGLRTSTCHEVTLPGAAKQFTDGGPFATYLFWWLLRQPRIRVEVLQHEDCGAYGPELHEDSPAELAAHHKDIARFAELAKRHGVKFTGGGLIELAGTIRRF